MEQTVLGLEIPINYTVCMDPNSTHNGEWGVNRHSNMPLIALRSPYSGLEGSQSRDVALKLLKALSELPREIYLKTTM